MVLSLTVWEETDYENSIFSKIFSAIHLYLRKLT